jgi:predicted DNA-binding transcriptional regulator AlpA
MEATQTRELISYATAMQLTGLPQRTFYKRLKQSLVPIYFDSADRRKRWLDRNDVAKLARTQEPERGTTAA